MSNKTIFSWRDILDCKFSAGMTLGEFIRLAGDVRYKFIAWNGIIYFIGKNADQLQMVGKVEDLENES